MTDVESRSLTALETIATELTALRWLLQEALTQTPEPETEGICSHPPDQRLQLGQTTGWQCMTCGHRETPDQPQDPGTTIRDRLKALAGSSLGRSVLATTIPDRQS